MKILFSGSMDFAKEMLEIKTLLESAGHQVQAPEDAEHFVNGVINKENENITPYAKGELIRRHYTMIENSDALLVVNEEKKGVAGYIGACSLIEMGYAFILKKSIYIWNKTPEMGYSDEIKAFGPIELDGDINKLH